MFVLTSLIFIVLVILDLTGKFSLAGSVGKFLGITLLPHIYLFVRIWLLPESFENLEFFGYVNIILNAAPFVLFALYWLVRLAVKPYRAKFDKSEVNIRIRAMYGGKYLLKYTAISLVFQTIFYIAAIVKNFRGLPKSCWIPDAVIAGLIIFGYGFNGIIRIMVLCRRLGIVKRVLAFFLLPVPIVGIFALIGLYRSANAEYDYETTRAACDSQRIESQVCATKYPILLVHGMGFRDWKYFNYWGRIPKELIKNGAKVYYGHQEACATIDTNSQLIKNKILEIKAETGCEKVNIIAHSKGGLDSRYAITKLGMADSVATLTTVGTPHHGSQVSDEADSLPDSFYRKVSDGLDKRFRSFGDNTPDFYTLAHQLSCKYLEEFNREVLDSDKVYYQSYASVMKYPFSFNLLGFTNLLLRKYGPNDGLVTVESAKWGNFRGTFETKRIRGISHGDTIDLKREDYAGFDPREEYVKIVSELKERGF